ncbi:MAG: hypothetical protein ACTSRW_16235 [Candidatus Helarchaeota archaeon]
MNKIDKPAKIIFLGALYILGGIALAILTIMIIVLALLGPNVIPSILLLVLPNGGFFAGDTFITIYQLKAGMIFVIPMFILTSLISVIGGYLFITTDKKLAWILMVASSILYCLILIGLIVDIIIIQKDVRDLYTS